MRISCPDATGLGCDIARLLLDFGLRIMDGESVSLPPWRLPAQDAILGHGCAPWDVASKLVCLQLSDLSMGSKHWPCRSS